MNVDVVFAEHNACRSEEISNFSPIGRLMEGKKSGRQQWTKVLVPILRSRCE
jgi:hypothetical protein